ncbi:MAG: hypothetical protein GY809_24655, partial [Planctomycetes bacterium]|nr:hypothetical protein [Planctomycetota bacterium]
MGLGQLRHTVSVPDTVTEPLETLTGPVSFETVLYPVNLSSLPDTTPFMGASVIPSDPEPASVRPMPWPLIGLGLWAVMSGLVLTRLAWQFALGLRLIRGRQSVENDALVQALAKAQNRLSLNRPVTLCFSPKISSPVIWCWFKTPILLIQDIADATQTCKDWVGVFCHELAHAKRLDHITNLCADLLCVALPWH